MVIDRVGEVGLVIRVGEVGLVIRVGVTAIGKGWEN